VLTALLQKRHDGEPVCENAQESGALLWAGSGAAGSLNVLFIDVPRDFCSPEQRLPRYRYMVSSLRNDGFSAGLLHPRAG
jgi:hypothetical protein